MIAKTPKDLWVGKPVLCGDCNTPCHDWVVFDSGTGLGRCRRCQEAKIAELERTGKLWQPGKNLTSNDPV